MSIEIELKLSIEPDAHELFAQLPLLKKATAYPPEELVSYYYDTPEKNLAQHRISLRTRQYGDTWHQTIKASAKAFAKFSAKSSTPSAKSSEPNSKTDYYERHEWEFVIPGPEPVFSVLSAELLDKINPLADKLQPIFITRFMRRNWELTLFDSTVIISLDKGKIVTPDSRHSLPISEVEIELKKGDLAILAIIADNLRLPSLPLPVYKKSKAKRGYNLLKQLDALHDSASL